MSEIDFNTTGDFSIGELCVYPSKNIIVAKAKETKVTPKVIAVLIILAKRNGETVSKDEIIEAVWGGVATTDMVLSKAISDLRKALGDTGQKQQWIKTVSKKGYALLGDVTWVDSDKNESTKDDLPTRSWSKPIFVVAIFSLVGFLIYGKYFNKPNDGYLKAPIIKNITADSKEQRHPRFSPDGKFVAYFEYSEKHLDTLVIQDLNSGEKKELKSFKQEVEMGPSKGISFSGDGERLAVRVNYKAGCQIIIIKLRSMVENKLNRCPFSTIASIDFSPDGKSIVTTEFIKERVVQNIVEIDLETEKTKLAGEELEQAGGYLFPRYNKQGNKVASIRLITATISWSIVITDLKTGKHETVYESDRQLNQVVWGDNDQALYFVSHQGTAPGIWRISLDTLAVTRVLNSSNEIVDLDYSETTGSFAYSESEYNFQIIQIALTAEGDYKESPLKLATKNNILASISPDGKILAYVSRDFGPDRLFVYSMNENENRLLYSGSPGRIVGVSWSPDSQKLMATQVNGDSSTIIMIDLISGEIIDLGKGANVSRGKWSSDGTEIYWLLFDGKQWDLMKFGADNIESKIAKLGLITDYQVIEGGEVIVRRPGWGSGTKLERISEPSLNNLDKKASLLINHRSLGDWAVSGDELFYLIVGKNESSLFSMELDGKSNMKIASFKGSVFNAGIILSMSRDREKIFTVVKNKVGSDLYLMSKE